MCLFCLHAAPCYKTIKLRGTRHSIFNLRYDRTLGDRRTRIAYTLVRPAYTSRYELWNVYNLLAISAIRLLDKTFKTDIRSVYIRSYWT